MNKRLVLMTVLFNRTQPLIRYVISDSLVMSEKPCPCGRPFALLSGIHGRLEDWLRFSSVSGGDVAVPPVIFHRVLDRVPARQWQVVQQSDRLRIHLSGVSTGYEDQKLSDELSQSLAAEGIVVPPIQVQRVQTIDRGVTGKARPFVSQ